MEHLRDENDKEDTQALGGASEEQACNLDESMAINSGAHDDEIWAEEPDVNLEENEEQNLSNEDPDHPNMMDEDYHNNDGQSHGATIGKINEGSRDLTDLKR